MITKTAQNMSLEQYSSIAEAFIKTAIDMGRRAFLLSALTTPSITHDVAAVCAAKKNAADVATERLLHKGDKILGRGERLAKTVAKNLDDPIPMTRRQFLERCMHAVYKAGKKIVKRTNQAGALANRFLGDGPVIETTWLSPKAWRR